MFIIIFLSNHFYFVSPFISSVLIIIYRNLPLSLSKDVIFKINEMKAPPTSTHGRQSVFQHVRQSAAPHQVVLETKWYCRCRICHFMHRAIGYHSQSPSDAGSCTPSSSTTTTTTTVSPVITLRNSRNRALSLSFSLLRFPTRTQPSTILSSKPSLVVDNHKFNIN